MVILFRILAFLIGYAFGNISPGRIFAKINKVDITKTGSGNVGSTNVARTFGMKIGVLNLVLDFVKALVPALIVFLIFRNNTVIPVKMLTIYAAYGAVIGHIFPVVFGFKGGKGIATNIGLILVMAPVSLIGVLISFFVIVIATRYVSLGSLSCAVVLPIEIWYMVLNGMLELPAGLSIEVGILIIIDAIVCTFMHRENIKRLLSGTESKFVVKKGGKNE